MSRFYIQLNLYEFQALTYQSGPTFIGDSLRLTREKVFNTTNGARSGAQKVAILFTDVIRDAKYAHAESLKLENAGMPQCIQIVRSCIWFKEQAAFAMYFS